MGNKWALALVVVVVLTALIGCGGAAATAAPATVQEVTPQTVAARLPQDLDNGLILLDVRTQQEWEEDGHIEGATSIPLDELEARAEDELPKDAEIIVYCRSGNRSAQGADFLVEHGYTNVSDMGGINGWTAAGYDVIYSP
jgi:rhodanese-related sulfurtransferase